MDNKEKEIKLTDAKRVSKVAIILSAVITVGYNILILFKTGRIPSIDEQQSVLLLGSGLIMYFSPIYLSIWLDKIFGSKGGGNK